LQHLDACLAVPLAAQQPARAFGKTQAKSGIDHRRKRRDPKHPAPGIFPNSPQQIIREKGDDNAKDDVELEQPRQPSAISGRRDLGNVERRSHGGDADAEAANEARGNEPFHVPCVATANG
jgi:hypothetical protein